MQVDKFVRVSPSRVTSAGPTPGGTSSSTASGLAVTALGAAGEVFSLAFIAPGSVVRTATCQVPLAGQASMLVVCSGVGSASTCTCEPSVASSAGSL